MRTFLNKLRTNALIKLLALLLCVAGVTACVYTAGPTLNFYFAGAYDSARTAEARDSMEQDTLREMLYFYLDRTQMHWENSRDNADYEDDLLALAGPETGYDFIIKDGKGKPILKNEEQAEMHLLHDSMGYDDSVVTETETVTMTCASEAEAEREGERLFQNYSVVNDWEIASREDGKFVLTAECGKTEYGQITITGYVRDPLAGDFLAAAREADQHFADRWTWLTVFLGGGLTALVCLLYLLWSTGVTWEKTETEETGRWRIPSDILLAVTVAAGLCFLAYVTDTLSPAYPMGAFEMAGVAVFSALFLLLARPLVVRLRRRTFCRGLFVVWLWRGVRKCVGRFLRGCADLFGQLPLFWRTALIFLGFCGLEGLSIIEIWAGSVFAVVCWFALKIVEALLLVKVVLMLRVLQTGGRALAAGDVDYQIPLDRLRWDFQAHGEDLNHLRDGIQTAVEKQMKSERMKTELITNVSHDIKTPLTSIVNYVDLLKKQEMPTDEAREYLDVLDRQSARLRKLTEDLVEASKASTGNLPVNLCPTDVNVMLSQAAGEYEEKLSAKNLSLVLTPAPNGPWISADGRLLWRVFDNLLGNACKYAQPGTRVYLSGEADGERVTLTFRNISRDPLNIPAEELLERFVRGDDSRSTEGSGLGLSIAKSLTSLQKGSLDIAIDGDLFKVTLTFPQLTEE